MMLLLLLLQLLLMLLLLLLLDGVQLLPLRLRSRDPLALFLLHLVGNCNME